MRLSWGSPGWTSPRPVSTSSLAWPIPRSRAAVISLARLYPEFYGQPRDPGRFKERAINEAVHELGHLLGLGHCPDPACVMAFSNSLADTDRKGPGFCQPCREKLGK